MAAGPRVVLGSCPSWGAGTHIRWVWRTRGRHLREARKHHQVPKEKLFLNSSQEEAEGGWQARPSSRGLRMEAGGSEFLLPTGFWSCCSPVTKPRRRRLRVSRQSCRRRWGTPPPVLRSTLLLIYQQTVSSCSDGGTENLWAREAGPGRPGH